MPVKELPMPPVQIQKPDHSGGVAVTPPDAKGQQPVPQLVLNLKL